ncbi:hypothetical protein DRQ33_06715 [bacterium]|nr:MAG: hypothetical protein DRQ33_06715 [bacterium]
MNIKYLVSVFGVLFIMVSISCEGPAGSQGEQGPPGPSMVYIDGYISANSLDDSIGYSEIYVSNVSSVPYIEINSIPYRYYWTYFRAEFPELSPGEDAIITMEAVNLNGDSVFPWASITVPGPLEFYGASENDTISLQLGLDNNFVWNPAGLPLDKQKYRFKLYLFLNFSDTTETGYIYQTLSIDTFLSDTTISISADWLPDPELISSLNSSSGYVYVSAIAGATEPGDASNIHGNANGFIALSYHSPQYRLIAELP